VIDPVDLLLVEDLGDQLVQLLGGGQVAAERLLDDDPRPAALLLGEARPCPSWVVMGA
jgi:hypothetical protein